MLLISIFALFLQLIFFTGYTAHPSDEGIILRNSYLVLKGEFLSLLKQYRSVRESGLYDPSEAFSFRPFMFLPIAFFWLVFGINEFTTVLWTIICFQGIIITTYFLGKILFNHKVGIIAAFLISIFPLQLLYSTRVSIDTPLTFFMGLSVLFFLKGEHKLSDKNTKYFLLSGLCLFFAYLVKITAVVLFGVYIFFILFYKRKIHKKYFSLLIIFLFGLMCESLFYYNLTDHPFLRHMVNRGFLLSKRINEPTRNITITNFLKLCYIESEPIFYLSYMFGLNVPIEYKYPHIEFFYFFVLLGVVICFLNRKRSSDFLLIWFFILFLWLEFGTTGIQVTDGTLNYWVVQKHDRYMMILSIPSVLILSYFISSLKNRVIEGIILLFLFISSLYFVNTSNSSLKDVTSDMKEAHSFLKDKPEAEIYCDYLCVDFLNYYSGYKRTQHLHILPINMSELENIKNAYVIVGGSRTVGICCIEEMQPKFIPTNWIDVFRGAGELNEFRKSRLIIYYVP
ncbi:MAG: glycosyltransferase family 39 protein [Candidatus Aenigmatarchaeota archaeon]